MTEEEKEGATEGLIVSSESTAVGDASVPVPTYVDGTLTFVDPINLIDETTGLELKVDASGYVQEVPPY